MKQIVAFLRRTPGAIYLTLAALLTVALALLIHHVASPRVVARVVAPDGTQLCLLQRPNWSDDPFFTTTFAYQKPGTNWQTFYYDHEDNYWGHSRVAVDTNAHVARFYRGQTLAVTFAWDTETYTLHRRNGTHQGGQWQMPAGWKPETAGK